MSQKENTNTNKLKPRVKEALDILPKKPGCYLFYDANDKLLYVGKAKSLKNRVSQYFQKGGSHKSIRMTSRIENIDFIVSETSYDALILEQNLIKSKKPIFNILLMDDKRYPYIQLTNTKHPKFIVTRTINPKNGIYFGPIAFGYNAKTLLELLNFMYPFRKCNRLPNKKCIYLDLKQCLGPCINEVTKETYEPMIKEVRKIFSGNITFLKQKIKTNLQNAIDSENYLLAKKWGKYLENVGSFQEEQSEFKDLNSHHAFAILEKGDILCIYTSFYLGGKWMGGSHSFLKIENTVDETIEQFFLNFYKTTPLPKEALVSRELNFNDLERILKTKFTLPKIGFKKKVIDKAISNCESSIKRSLPAWKGMNTQREKGHNELEENIGRNLYSIMMLDNAHIVLENYVSAFVTFINGVPQKQYYRYVNLEKDKVRDDTEATYRAVKKGFRSYKTNTSIFCDLLIVDGGKGQLRAAKRALEELELNIQLAAIVKDENHQTSHLLLEDESRVNLKAGPLLRYLSIMQDEAHRFVNKYFQSKRENDLITQTSKKIDFVGQSTWNKLIKRFQTIENIKNASLSDLEDILPKKSARSIFDFFHERGNDNG